MTFMDLLHRRYASPLPLVDNMIQTGQFQEFVDFLLKKEIEEKDDQRLWEFYLHKVADKSFNDFRSEIESERGRGVIDEAKKKEIVKKSESILNGFVPPAEGSERR